MEPNSFDADHGVVWQRIATRQPKQRPEYMRYLGRDSALGHIMWLVVAKAGYPIRQSRRRATPKVPMCSLRLEHMYTLFQCLRQEHHRACLHVYCFTLASNTSSTYSSKAKHPRFEPEQLHAPCPRGERLTFDGLP